MTSALNTIQPGMWATAYADSQDAWQIASRHMSMLKVIDDHPYLAKLLDQAMMAVADGIVPAPFIAATDVLHMARVRVADHQRQQAEQQPRHGENAAANGHGQPTAQFTPAVGHPATSAQVTQ